VRTGGAEGKSKGERVRGGKEKQARQREKGSGPRDKEVTTKDTVLKRSRNSLRKRKEQKTAARITFGK